MFAYLTYGLSELSVLVALSIFSIDFFKGA